jgi:2-keto-4-pentenoate hydratase/2-oxohepta-3-ene-1,7-dioic acid hydratase in catechol pathway
MRVCRFDSKGTASWGLVEDAQMWPLAAAPFDRVEKIGSPVAVDSVRLLPPCQPSKVIAIGLNYKDHISEFGRTEIPTEPVLFLKAVSSVIGAGEPIVIPSGVSRVDYEGEMAVVIGREGRYILEEKANDYIFGVTCLNDVTARSLQKKDGQWARAKSFDTFSPLGPYIARGISYDDLAIETRLNGRTVQSSRTSEMIFSIPKLVAFVSTVMTLFPGDVISTGTPMGVGPVQAGDVVEISLEGIGVLKNPVVNERSR